MMRLALAFALVLVASTASAQTAAIASGSSLVLVFDGNGAHVNGDRVRRALAAGLHRPVLRLTDDGASGAAGRLTIAFSAPDRWVIDLVRGDVHAVRNVILHDATVAALARIALTVVSDTEPATPAPTASATPRHAEWIALIGDEILDPFAGQPYPTRARRMAQLQELVDPFSGAAGARRGYDDVIDPWSR